MKFAPAQPPPAPAKTRILFVDDEPIILELLQLSVSSVKTAWESTFAKSAEEALALMAKGPFDIVVSDMQLPGRSGAQLLNEVMQRSPATIRIILSGYGDRELVMRCVGATHQFLAKPFKLSDLKATLKRVNDLKKRLRSNEIRRLVAQEQCLPSIPAVYFKILDALQDPNCPVERIGEIVATDPGLTSKILQLVNSAFLGFAREVASADEAVMLLGTGPIRSMALTLHLFSAFSNPQGQDGSLERVGGHSIRVGQLAQRIAKLEGADEKLTEEAFTAGLLHDVGKLILAENPSVKYLELMAQARQAGRTLIEAESAALQATHAEVGAYLLDLWGLPLPLVEAVAWHHEPGRTSESGFSPLTAVHVANVLAQETAPSEGPRDQLDSDYLSRLNLGQRVEAWRQDLIAN
jgi:putative nucleotidyltransferase with HDIG domain